MPSAVMESGILQWLVREQCVTSPWILFGLVLGDAAIACVYLWIPVMLRRVLREAGDITGKATILGFARFVGACGVTHVLGILTIFMPELDWPRVGWLAWTAAISLQAAIGLKRAERVIVAALIDRKVLEAQVG